MVMNRAAGPMAEAAKEEWSWGDSVEAVLVVGRVIDKDDVVLAVGVVGAEVLDEAGVVAAEVDATVEVGAVVVVEDVVEEAVVVVTDVEVSV